MKLKKLEITGFKSFFDRACIEFPKGISAVVGPNGCGKSNIIDALKWVMGEQSVKQLRGKSMEDVIFAGARGKAPLNMAEVSLTLVNDNGSVPEEFKDFSEIMITRRQYRSGERSYLLNKQPCRLKDIHNIFWGSGMGARSYAVIQQGNIGAITDAGPEERRGFIDEAAGVTRYKNRKNEALRKVNATHQNLLRVKDIISEVKRQMNGLQRQAQKAERYKKYQGRIREYEVQTAIYYFDELEKQLQEADAVLKDLRDKDIAHGSQLSRLDAEIEKIKLERSSKNQLISAQKAKKFEVQRKTDRLENDLLHLKQNLEGLTSEIEALEAARIDLEKKNQQIGIEVVQVEEETQTLQHRIEADRQTLEKEKQSAGSIQEELGFLNQHLEREKKRLMELVADEARYKNIYQNASNNRENIKRRLKRVDEEEFKAKQTVSELERKKQQAADELAELQDEVRELTERIESIKSELTEKSQTLSSQVKQVQTLDLEYSKVKSQHAALVKMEKNFEWYKGGVQAIMKQGTVAEDGQKALPEGVIGLMADIVTPKAGYETAVEAVLGEALQYILVENQGVGMQSIEYLQETRAGRGGFIPVSRMKPESRDGEDAAAASSDRLLNYVHVKAGYEEIAKAMLGHIRFAGSFSQAMELWNSSNGNGPQTVVSRDGDLVSSQGIMIGGSQDQLSGILAKKQEIRKLEQRSIQLSEALSAAREEQYQLEGAVRILETDLQKCIEEKNSAVRDETEAEKQLYKIMEELKHTRRHLEIVQLEQEQLLGEESDIDDEMQNYNQALARIETEVADTQGEVARTTEKISTVSEQMEAFNQKVLDIKLRLTSLGAKFENSNQTYRRLKDFQEDGIRRLEQLTREIEVKKARGEESREKIGQYDRMLPEMYETFQRLELELESNETDYRSIDQRLQESDATVATLKNERDEILEKRRYLELEQQQRKIKQENIAARLLEKYNRSLQEFKAERDAEDGESNPKGIREMETEMEALRKKLEKIGDVNLGAIHEYEELKNRYEFLTSQQEDLFKALEDLQKVIRKINRITQDRFIRTFDQVNEKLDEIFPKLFNGGTAKLVLTEPDNPLETGVEFLIHPPGKKLTRLSLLSGGEKALSAIAFIFSIFLIKPASFCLMDEIDAPLDEANVDRFNEMVKMIGGQSQIVMITHNKRSMEYADTLFGVTMETKGISKIVSVNFGRAQVN